jgi:tellurite resistance protein
MSTLTLPKQSFLALAAIGWSDGSLQRIEATGLLRAAKECGMAGGDLAEIERAAKAHVALDAASVGGLSQWEQVLTYALASWFASLDGIASTDERETLAKLGDALGLDPPLRVRAAAAANDIACLPEGGRPDRYDFVKLVARLRERLPQIAK